MCLMRVGLCVPNFTYLHRWYLSSGALPLPTYYLIIYNYIYIYVCIVDTSYVCPTGMFIKICYTLYVYVCISMLVHERVSWAQAP